MKKEFIQPFAEKMCSDPRYFADERLHRRHIHDTNTPETFLIQIDLQQLEELVGKGVMRLGIPLESVELYTPGPNNQYDGAESLRNAYRRILRKEGQLVAIPESDLRELTRKRHFMEKGVEYLTLPDGELRVGWAEGNEAVLKSRWVFPAGAMSAIKLDPHFDSEQIMIEMLKGDEMPDSFGYKRTSEGVYVFSDALKMPKS